MAKKVNIASEDVKQNGAPVESPEVFNFEDKRNSFLQKIDFLELNKWMLFVPWTGNSEHDRRQCMEYVNKREDLKAALYSGKWLKPRLVPNLVLGKFQHGPVVRGVYEERCIDKERNTYAMCTYQTARLYLNEKGSIVMDKAVCANYQNFELFASSRANVFGSPLSREECAELWNNGYCTHTVNSENKLNGKTFVCNFDVVTGHVVSRDIDTVMEALNKKIGESRLYGIKPTAAQKRLLVTGREVEFKNEYGKSVKLQCQINDGFVNFVLDHPIEPKAVLYNNPAVVESLSQTRSQEQSQSQGQGQKKAQSRRQEAGINPAIS